MTRKVGAHETWEEGKLIMDIALSAFHLPRGNLTQISQAGHRPVNSKGSVEDVSEVRKGSDFSNLEQKSMASANSKKAVTPGIS